MSGLPGKHIGHRQHASFVQLCDCVLTPTLTIDILSVCYFVILSPVLALED